MQSLRHTAKIFLFTIPAVFKVTVAVKLGQFVLVGVIEAFRP